MRSPQPILARLTPAILATGLFSIYVTTMAPGLTWAHGGSDGGDLIAAAATGGVAHPTGYPIYLLVARLFQSLPIGSLAYRTNLLSAAAMVGAATLCYVTVRRELAAEGFGIALVAGGVSALAFGLAPMVWSQALITEVYALHLLFVSLLIYLSSTRSQPTLTRSCLLGVLQGVAAGNHLLAALLAPAVILACCLERRSDLPSSPDVRPKRHWNWRRLGGMLLGILAGLLVYAVLPARAQLNPPVNWGNVVTPARLLWLTSGDLYQRELMQIAPASPPYLLRTWAVNALEQFGAAGLILGLLGIILFIKPGRLQLLTLWTAGIFTSFGLVYAVQDAFVYVLPAYLSLAIWIGVGIGRLSARAATHMARAYVPIGVIAVLYVGALAAGTWPRVDASRDMVAESYGATMMSQAPADAVLFAQGDRAVFTLWYFHYALHQRSDLAVIAAELLPFDWYRENLRSTYPELTIPEATPDLWMATIRRANPDRPACFAAYPEPALTCEPG